MFRIIDDDGNRQLSLQEFKKGCRDYGLDLEADAVQEMFRQFDRDGSGSIDFDEFLRALRVCINLQILLPWSSAIQSSLPSQFFPYSKTIQLR